MPVFAGKLCEMVGPNVNSSSFKLIHLSPVGCPIDVRQAYFCVKVYKSYGKAWDYVPRGHKSQLANA